MPPVRFMFLCASSAILATMLTAPALAAQQSVRIVDGDTIELSGIVYRLHGIDAPEAGQTCMTAAGAQWPCGKSAISALEGLALGKAVKCDSRGQDDYGRTIGVCTVNNVDLNAAMVSNGYAWAFRKYSADYGKAEDEARARKVGVWQAQTQTPWEYRAAKWEVAKQDAPEGCPIKGNISKNGNIYHAPWSPWYLKTKVSLDQGERWFCSESDAVKAGWRAPYWGR